MVYFVSPDDVDDVKVILEQISIRTADYYKPGCVSCNKKTIVYVIQHAPLSTLGEFTFL